MSKLRILFAIPCLALSMALVGCGGSESTFVPAEGDSEETMPDAADYMSGKDPRGGDGAAKTPAAPGTPAAPEGGSGEPK